ncbi:hypothetical protein [Micromonospora tarensis]|uniref:Uncharacterized protein n=1 Tax=Micromonospora tarensis TaxID=2806100 RepID=A0ABS1YCM1_9ACTN|nr:hypothetical protein [Micromonospora tarensis]MBM0275113.1 hypothetical protein [Micromonospora tarensis]
MTVSRTRTRHRPVTQRPATAAADPTRCVCRGGVLIATFRREQLAALEYRHHPLCLHPAQPVDVDSWLNPW